MVAPPSKLYTVSTVLFHKYGGANVEVTNCMSQLSIFFPTEATVKLANGNMVHSQLIDIILCRFPNCYIIYRVGLVYYFPGHPSNTISSGALKFYAGFQKVVSEPFEHFGFFDPQGVSWRSPYYTQINLDYLQIEICQSQPSKRQEYCCPKFLCNFKTKSLSDYL